MKSLMKDFNDLVNEQKKQFLKLKEKYTDIIDKKIVTERHSSVLSLLTKGISWISKQWADHTIKLIQSFEPDIKEEEKRYKSVANTCLSNIVHVDSDQ